VLENPLKGVEKAWEWGTEQIYPRNQEEEMIHDNGSIILYPSAMLVFSIPMLSPKQMDRSIYLYVHKSFEPFERAKKSWEWGKPKRLSQ
jgi:hypothetical protein